MRLKYKWNDKCKCGHSYELHKWDYANNKVNLEGCKHCACERFVFGTKWSKRK